MTEHQEWLMRYAQGGDAEAFAEIVREYSGMVYSTCLRVTRNRHDAEDAAQKCFLELARKAQAVKSRQGTVCLCGSPVDALMIPTSDLWYGSTCVRNGTDPKQR